MGLIARNINMAGRLRGVFPQVPPPPPAPNIVTSGLIMNLDAGNPASYPGLNNGRTWSTGWSGNFVNPESSFDGSLSSGTQVAADNQSATYTFASGGLSVTGTVRVAVALGASSGQAGDITNIILINGVDITQKIKDAGLYLTVGWIDVTSEVGATFNTIVLNRIFGRANPFLCAIEVNGQVLLNNTTNWVDLTGNGNNGTLVNGPTYNSANGGSIVFDGVNDYVSFNSLGSVTDWTVSLMLASSNKTFAEVIYPFGFTTSGQFSGGIDVGGWGIFSGNVISIYDGTNNSGNSLLANYNIPLNTYMNVVATKSGTTYDIYVNGIKLTTGTLANRPLSNIRLGMRADNVWPFAGNIGVCMIYNRALNQSEVTQNWNALRGRYGL